MLRTVKAVKVVIDDENYVEYKDGDPIFLIDVRTSHAVFDGSGCVAREKVYEKTFGRIGHTKNYAIDEVISALESLKDKEN
jgi:hypothetical protein